MAVSLGVILALVSGIGSPEESASARSQTEPELLAVFVSPEASKLARVFQSDHLPAIREVAMSLGVPVRVIDIRDGAPAEVTITPLLVYQNHRGRSIFQGRYATVDRLRNFLRTSRVVPQGKEPLVRRSIAVRRTGRSVVGAPIRIAPVTGDQPKGYDHGKFAAEALRAISKGFNQFRLEDSIQLGRADRLFYMDFNPWVSRDGKLFLAVELYSQFHCKNPIFARPGESFTGSWEERAELFKQAARALEKSVNENVATSTVGDGFDPVPRSVGTVSWASLGMGIPPRPQVSIDDSVSVALGRNWAVEIPKENADASTGQPPQVVFRFPAPHDAYSGEVGKVTGELHLPHDLALGSAAGFFVAEAKSVTMGDPDLDHSLHSDTLFLDADKHPTSRFVIESVSAEPGARLSYGELANVTMAGKFTLKGVSIPISVRTVFEPVVNADGQPRVLMRGAFQIRLSPFNISGPDPSQDGSDAHDTLLFDFNLILAPR